ncbi:hypothetical protein HYH03_009403 [Edaphochlamys debaryana]|uniref:Sulfatase N-terminal domain-containing protein n=1 Tax=Edaphochlamys debaryana TaxID=47281 RepID=A0A836BXZ6_9CHLO|nr:hypothetical protein HYH03_009403 [Edaphochlamys debaryana]|eukprot:KAG2492462.1 hypothetical protein HYH03_009403 [Edaphochlamys debaryana]
MPALHRLLGQGGTRLSNFLVSTGVCCPARTSLLTGRLAHCTNVTSNFWDMQQAGGFRKFYEQKLDREWLPTLLTAGGYDTYLVGKFLNEYLENATFLPPNTTYKPLGLAHSEALTYRAYHYTNSCFSVNGTPSVCFPGQYQTDFIRDRATDLISRAAGAQRPFFLAVTPTAPHRANNGSSPIWSGPTPASRHAGLYLGERIEVPKGPNWRLPSSTLPRSPSRAPEASYRATMDTLHLLRLRSLRAVDELIDAVVQALDAAGVLDNTYVLFSSDNGYHLGAFGLLDGKNTPIEEDVRVPLYVRGPGIPAGAVLPYQGNMVDLAPTILALAGLPIPDAMDGLPLPLNPDLEALHAELLRAATPGPVPPTAWPRPLRDTNILEGWNGEYIKPELYNISMHYKGLRLCTEAKLLAAPRNASALAAEPGNAARFVYAPNLRCYKYTVWCQGHGGLFDLSTDPYEVLNRLTAAPSRVLDRLDAVLSALVHCRGTECRSPYGLLHPGGGVYNFTEALDPKHDSFYATLPKLRIRSCTVIYMYDNELTWRQLA